MYATAKIAQSYPALIFMFYVFIPDSQNQHWLLLSEKNIEKEAYFSVFVKSG